MKCIDCDYKFSCGKANNTTVCEKYCHTSKVITRLEEKDGDVFKFKIMEKEDE